MDQAKVDRAQVSEVVRGLKTQLGEGKDAVLLPKVDLFLDLRCPKQVGSTRQTRWLLHWGRSIHVIATAIVLRTISTLLGVSPRYFR